jgi:Uma2 family endonuclease
MFQPRPEGHVFDLVDSPPPTAPPTEPPSEGDARTRAIIAARSTLTAFFRRVRRRIYVSSHLDVHYPGEPRFAPDVLAVRDVDPHDREKWAVVTERKGLTFVLDVRAARDRDRDDRRNMERYARLGIPEYFILDVARGLLSGYRLPEAGNGGGRRSYERIVPHAGRYRSEALDLELTLEGRRLRFLYGMAAVPDEEEVLGRLEQALGEALRAREEEGRLREDAERRAEEAEQALAEAQAEIERLRGARTGSDQDDGVAT